MNKRAFLLGLGALAARPAFALYDPTPNALLADLVGSWQGTLTYRDYQDASKTETLPTQLTVSLSAPDELALYYVFNDGPGKTVYSYERMAFDLARSQLTWQSGVDKPERDVYHITAAAKADGATAIAFIEGAGDHPHRYTLDVTRQSWRLMKFEQDKEGVEFIRNTYQVARA